MRLTFCITGGNLMRKRNAIYRRLSCDFGVLRTPGLKTMHSIVSRQALKDT